jgi:hypothetical protein
MLTSDTDDALVILIGYVKGDRCWHFLLNQIEAVLGGFVLAANNVDVEVVFVETIKDDLNIA